MEEQVVIELFGGVRLLHPRGAQSVTTRFRTYKVKALLAYLAFYHGRVHAREVLIEMFWPDAPSRGSGQNNLSVTLSSIRSLLEPAGTQPNSLLLSDRLHIGLNSDHVTTDVLRFETHLVLANSALDPVQAIAHWNEAIRHYRFPLLPGLYESWILPEQDRLASRLIAAAGNLSRRQETCGEIAQAVQILRDASGLNPGDHDTQRNLIRLLIETGQASIAVEQFRYYERWLREKVNDTPPEDVYKLISRFIPRCEGNSLRTTYGVRDHFSNTHRTDLGSAGTRRRNEEAHPRTAEGRFGLLNPFVCPANKPDDARSTQKVRPDAPLPSSHEPYNTTISQAALERVYGRQKEIQAILESLENMLTCTATRTNVDNARWNNCNSIPSHARLITLTGPIGIGKTRLSLAALSALNHTFRSSQESQNGIVVEHSCHFVSLEASKTVDAFLEAVALAIRIPGSYLEAVNRSQVKDEALAFDSSHALMKEILSHLERIRHDNLVSVVVLDGFDHLIPLGAARYVAALLREAGNLICLVTSCQRLALEGEVVVSIAPLPYPHLEDLPIERCGEALTPCIQADRLEDTLNRCRKEFPSVIFFAEHARRLRSDFRLDAQNIASVMEIAFRLEGNPLALELAANRTLVMTPQRICTQLRTDSRRQLELLVNHRRSRQDRHRSLRNALLSCCANLSPEVQQVLARLSVLQGMWTIEAAHFVTGDVEILDGLTELCDNSLLVTCESKLISTSHTEGASPHFDTDIYFKLLKGLRDVALEQLSVAEKEELEARHFHYYSSLAQVIELRLAGKEQIVWLDRLAIQYDNMRAALEWAANQILICQQDGSLDILNDHQVTTVVSIVTTGEAGRCIASYDVGRLLESSLYLARTLYAYWHIQGLQGEERRYIAEQIEWLSSCRKCSEPEVPPLCINNAGASGIQLIEYKGRVSLEARMSDAENVHTGRRVDANVRTPHFELRDLMENSLQRRGTAARKQRRSTAR